MNESNTAARDGPGSPQTGAPGKVALPLAQALERVAELYGAGRLDQAERVCRQILERHPNLADANNMLGVIRNALGDPKEAVAALGRAIKLNPGAASYHANLGEVERQRGRLVEAELSLTKAIELDPRSAQALSNLGIVHFDRKQFAEAAACYERAIAIQPSFPEAHNNLGNAYRALERVQDAIACYQRAVTQRAQYAEAYNNMATALRDLEDHDSAEHAYRKAIAINPRYVEAYNNLSILLAQLDRTEDALRFLGDALRVDERHAGTLVNVAKVQLKRGDHATAEQAVRIALAQEPANADALAVLAQVNHELDRHEAALAFIEQAVAADPDAAELLSFKGVILKSLGRMDEAREAILRAIEINPKHYTAYSNLNDLVTFDADNPLVEQMRGALAAADDPQTERYIPLHFALAKALDDCGDHIGALGHYGIGARLRRKQIKYDEADTFSFFEKIKATFPPEIFRDRPWQGLASTRPVFIVGMPRSGSTLVEQILSSHPDVYGAGEVKILHRSMAMLRDRFPSIPKFPMMMKALQPEHFHQIASSYLSELERSVAPPPARITDKLLTNYFFVGLINILFPNAKIIHTVRNPVDTCLSAYTKLFKDDMPHTYDLAELGRYYLRYQDLMAHWDQVLPAGVMLTMTYEDVIADLETNARALVAHLGLDWNAACLAFHESDRPVKTASVVQVRKPVYTTSLARWRRYGDGLAPLVEALGFQDAG